MQVEKMYIRSLILHAFKQLLLIRLNIVDKIQRTLHFFVDHHKCHQYFPDSSRHHGEKHSASELLQRFLKDQLHLWFNKDDKAFKPLKISHGSIKPHFLAQKSQKVVQAQLFFPKYLLLSK